LCFKKKGEQKTTNQVWDHNIIILHMIFISFHRFGFEDLYEHLMELVVIELILKQHALEIEEMVFLNT